MNDVVKRPRNVFIALVLATFFTFGLALVSGHWIPGGTVAVLATLIAFVKARFVIGDFMGLRGTRAIRMFDIWLLVACAVCLALVYRAMVAPGL
ncbi:MAG: cytochrome C oxidase subunit IV family protein [Rudaea sp.]|uniref:cytochrome C oxidase subunit IV family protein n=1 Tax=Rudaea sp. TaxID=2136325 RepID=UPI0039E46291